MKQEQTLNNIITSSDENYMTLAIPPVYYWEPKEDITAYELALCLPFLFPYYSDHSPDKAATYSRHFRFE